MLKLCVCIDWNHEPSIENHILIRSSQCGVTKLVVCVFFSVCGMVHIKDPLLLMEKSRLAHVTEAGYRNVFVLAQRA